MNWIVDPMLDIVGGHVRVRDGRTRGDTARTSIDPSELVLRFIRGCDIAFSRIVGPSLDIFGSCARAGNGGTWRNTVRTPTGPSELVLRLLVVDGGRV